MYKITIPTVVTNGHFNREKTLDEIKRCGAERIAIAIDREMDFTFSSPENLKLVSELISYYKENGLETLVWLGETFGHAGSPATGNSPYTNIRFIERGDISAFCPLDESFKADFCAWVKSIAECGADMIMLDDDFRQGYRGGIGCFCDLHMSAVEKETGEKIAFEDLKTKIFEGGENKYRDAWMKVQRDAMNGFAKALRDALDEVNPDARLGYCVSPGMWDSEGTDVIELAQIMAGNTKPFIRPCGAPYWTYNRNNHTLGEVIEYQRMQAQWCREHDIELFTEGDTYPRPRCETPASYLECYDTALRADGMSDGILKYVLDYVSDADYETGYIDAAVANKELYKKIDSMFSGRKAVGVRPFNVIHQVKNAKLDTTEAGFLDNVQNYIFSPAHRLAVFNALPITYEKGNVNIIFGENGKYIPEDELKYGNIIDIKAAEILMDRGIDVGIESISDGGGYEQTGFTDVPNEYFIDEDEFVRLSSLGISYPKHKRNVKMLTEYHTKTTKAPGVFEYENEDGIRFLVFPFDAVKARQTNANGWFDSYSRRRQLVKSIEWLQNKPLKVYADGNYPRLYVQAKENEAGISVGLWNLFGDKIQNAKIKAECDGDVEFINCIGHREDNTVIIDSVIYPFEFAGFEIKK